MILIREYKEMSQVARLPSGLRFWIGIQALNARYPGE
jgi:hypothetical protein